MSGAHGTPPRGSAWLIARLLDRRVRAPVLGDLQERFDRRRVQLGRGAARRWYRRQAAGFLLRVPVARLRGDLNLGTGPLAGLTALGRDVRFAARNLRARPGFALPVIGVFALAVAANTLVLGLVDAVLLRRLPYPEPDSLMLLWDRPTEGAVWDMPVTLRHFRTWQERDDLFATIGAYETSYDVVRWEQGTERAHGLFASPEILSMLGARPVLGRLLQPEDEAERAAPVVVLSHRTWTARFGSDPQVIGREISIDDRATEIVGVTPPDFFFYDPYMYARSTGGRDAAETQFWMPLRRFHTEEDYPALRVLARLAPGMVLERASAAVIAHRAALAPEAGRQERTSELVPLRAHMVGRYEDDLGLLTLVVLMVLAVACANVVSLLLTRSAARRQELWLRRALGAGRAAIARTVLAEAVLLSLAGGLVGLALATPLVDVVIALTPRDMPLVHRAEIDWRVALGTLVLAGGSGLVVGAIQAFGVVREREPAGAAGTPGRTVVSSAGAWRFGLTALQVSASIVLLVAAATAGTTFLGLARSDPGFDPQGVLTFESQFFHRPAEEQRLYADRLLEAIAALPGVEAVAGGTTLPLSGWASPAAIRAAGAAPEAEPLAVKYRVVTPEYFATLRQPLLGGRVFDATDAAGAPSVAVLNQEAARRLDDQSAAGGGIGSLVQVHIGSAAAEPVEVVGIAADAVEDRLGESPVALIYLPAAQRRVWGYQVAVRTPGRPLDLVEPIRAVATELDPRAPLSSFRSLDGLLRTSIAQQSFFAQLLSAFGGLALVLACAGVYGTVAYAARVRLPEMGVRKAFGAGAGAVRRLMLGHSLRPVGVGLLLGVPGAMALDRTLVSLIPGAETGGVGRYTVLLAAFVVISTVAALGPAQRAAQVDPAHTLRELQ